jgi:predicted nucleic acid-binding protein
VTRFLLDTNVISELRKSKPHGGVLAWVNALGHGQIFLAAFTLGEIQAGIELVRRRDAAKAVEIEAWLNALPDLYQVLPMDTSCFREWARLTTGKSDALLRDAFIAATALVHGLTVATRNGRDFTSLGVRLFNPFEYR